MGKKSTHQRNKKFEKLRKKLNHILCLKIFWVIKCICKKFIGCSNKKLKATIFGNHAFFLTKSCKIISDKLISDNYKNFLVTS